MALTRLGVCGPSAAYPGFAISTPRPEVSVFTRLGLCGPSAAYAGFTAKGVIFDPSTGITITGRYHPSFTVTGRFNPHV